MSTDEPAPVDLTINLKDTVSIVIGSSEGIGAAIAVGLARAGSTVVCGGRDEDRMADTLARIEGHGGTASFSPVDTREPDSIRAFGEAVADAHGAATILINSMGGTLISDMFDVEVEAWDNLHATHLRGSLLTCQTFGRQMREKGYGKIVNVSSLAAVRMTARRGSYAVAKAGLNQLTVALASEWGQYGIRVNGLAPSTTRTPRALAQFTREPQREAGIVARTPLGRLAWPEDMVGPALFLASPLSDFVSGQTLAVDGGMLSMR